MKKRGWRVGGLDWVFGRMSWVHAKFHSHEEQNKQVSCGRKLVVIS